MSRVTRSHRAGEEVFEHISEVDGAELLHRLGKMGLVKLISEIVEREVTEFLGRDYYQRRCDDQPHRGYRNGYREKPFKTGEGSVKVPIARVRDTAEPFTSQLLGRLGGQTDRLERMAMEMYARGLSTRDIEEVLRDDDGSLLLSRNSVSQITSAMWAEYVAFAKADLSELEVE